MNQVFPLIHEFGITEADQARLSFTHEFSITDADQARLYFSPEFGPTYIQRIRIREVTNIGVSDLQIQDLNLYHPEEEGSLSGFAYDAADDSYIVEQEFGFDPSQLRVSYSLYGYIDGVGYRYWSYKDQVPEVVWS